MNGSPVSRICGYSLFTLFIVLPLFEWRGINYSFFGDRSISLFVILYFLSVVPLVIKQVAHQPEKGTPVEFKIFLYLIYGSLALFIATWELLSAKKTAGANTFTLIGMAVLFISAQIVFRKYSSKIWKHVPHVVMCMAAIYATSAIIFLHFVNGTSLVGYIDVIESPIFTFSVRPWQLATIAAFSALLGTAIIIGSSREWHIYWIVPSLGYVVALTGSRSGFAGFWILWLVLSFWIVRERIKVDGKRRAQALAAKLIGAVLIGLMALTLLPKTNLFDRYNTALESAIIPSESAIIPSESARYQLWSSALKGGPASGQEPIIGTTKFGSFHNAFLDIYVSSGYPAMLSFMVLIVTTGIGLIRAFTLSNLISDRTIRFALLLCFIQLLVHALINPMLSFTAAWLMLGIFAASLGVGRLVVDDRNE